MVPEGSCGRGCLSDPGGLGREDDREEEGRSQGRRGDRGLNRGRTVNWVRVTNNQGLPGSESRELPVDRVGAFLFPCLL